MMYTRAPGVTVLALTATLLGYGSAHAQVEGSYSASPVADVPRINSFGLPPAANTAERMNSPIAVERVREGDEGAETPTVEGEESPLDPRERDRGFYPQLTVGYTKRSNPRRQGDADDSSSDEVLTVAPGLLYRSRLGPTSFQAGYAGTFTRWNETEQNDVNTHSIEAGALIEPNDVLGFGIQGGYLRSAEEAGASGSRIEDFDEELDKYERTRVGGQVTVGRSSSTLQFVAAVGTAEIDYLNNDQQLRDRDYDSVSATVLYNLSPKTRFFVEADHTEIDYQDPAVDRDSDEDGLYAGVLWSITPITRAEIKAGQLEKKFDNPAFDDYDGSSYLGKLQWSPLPYVNVNFYGSKRTEESPEVASSYFVSDLFGVNMSWGLRPELLSLTGYYNYTEDDFTSGRLDEITDWGLGLNYYFRPWLSLGLRYGNTERDSNLPSASFNDDFWGINVTGRLQ